MYSTLLIAQRTKTIMAVIGLIAVILLISLFAAGWPSGDGINFRIPDYISGWISASVWYVGGYFIFKK